MFIPKPVKNMREFQEGVMRCNENILPCFQSSYYFYSHRASKYPVHLKKIHFHPPKALPGTQVIVAAPSEGYKDAQFMAFQLA